LYVLDVPSNREALRAWRPNVPGIAEVLHARFVDHAYPPHTHDTWTLLIVDDGAISYDLDRHHHGAESTCVTLLPPHIPHDGRAATGHGFRKRVVYLEESTIESSLAGAAASGPALWDPLLRRRVDQLHRCIADPADALEAESRLAFIGQRLTAHLRPGRAIATTQRGSARLAARLREMLDEALPTGLTLADAANILGAHPSHLVRSFSNAYGVAPHAYLIGRRIDVARRLLLTGHTPAATATAAGFFDQAHLTRHFRRYLGVTPGRYAASPWS
jgi:AraC-like DNA-binding protein